jgi:hypothetical protein
MEAQSSVPWSDLVVAILAVNSWSVEKVYALLPALEDAGLLNPGNLADWEVGALKAALEKSGYSRGDYITTLMATRLNSLGMFVTEIGRERCEHVLRAASMAGLEASLGAVRGIGPAVIRNYVFLRGTDGQ